ncbi:hypothetical protein VTP01DRAFT_2290 [Rhizomucor pusillus]|uniref:uncharacterized protein n=1 Tax=Rhizomucor pusillus TaxID=4840 RepID=UPI003742ACBD
MTSVLSRHLKYQPSRTSPSSFLPHHFKSPVVLLYFNRPTPRVQSASAWSLVNTLRGCIVYKKLPTI